MRSRATAQFRTELPHGNSGKEASIDQARLLFAGADRVLDNRVVVVLANDGRRVDRFKTKYSQDGHTQLACRLGRRIQQQRTIGVHVGKAAETHML